MRGWERGGGDEEGSFYPVTAEVESFNEISNRHRAELAMKRRIEREGVIGRHRRDLVFEGWSIDNEKCSHFWRLRCPVVEFEPF
jgi:hypothetical protein